MSIRSAVAGTLLAGALAGVASGAPCRLAAGGEAVVSIVVGTNAGVSVRQSAERLRGMLERITGAPFAVESGSGKRGIALGLAEDFPALAEAAARLPVGDPVRSDYLADRQAYLLQSHPDGVLLLGAGELAVEYAVWDVLHRLGYRQFFPGEAWEIVPVRPDLMLDVDSVERPDYLDRRLSGPCGASPEWAIRNRLNLHGGAKSHERFLPDMPARWKSTFIHTAHAYSYIVRDSPEAFKAHPEWMALVDGERGRSTFLCISQPGLREFVGGYAVRYLERHPEFWSVSMEPTDGNGWCQCAACAKLGARSNRPVLLANAVADAVARRFPGEHKRVGMLGYGFHWQPPDRTLHERVTVLVTTKTLCPGEGNNPPMEERLAGWGAKASQVGVYDYASLLDWGGGWPGVAAAADTRRLADIVPRYHAMGARVWLAEASGSWGACGLGYYLAGRMLWDVREGGRREALVEDFLEKAFGPARDAMRDFYRVIEGGDVARPGNPTFIRRQVGRMAPPLLRARAAASDDPAVRRRIDQLLRYTRFTEGYGDWLTLSFKKDAGLDGVGDREVREAALRVLRLGLHLRETPMIDWEGVWRPWATRHAIAPGELSDDPPVEPDLDAWAEEAAARYGAGAEPAEPLGRFAVRLDGRTLLDAGGFEAETVLGPPPDGTNASGWTVSEGQPGQVRIVEAGSGANGAKAGAGRRFLRLARNGGETHVAARFARQTNGWLDVEWLARGDPLGDGDHAMQVMLKDGGADRLSLITRLSGDVAVHADGAWRDAGLDYDGLKWDRWRIRYELGTSRFELSVGGRTVTNLPVRSGGAVDRVVVRVGHEGAVFDLDGDHD